MCVCVCVCVCVSHHYQQAIKNDGYCVDHKDEESRGVEILLSCKTSAQGLYSSSKPDTLKSVDSLTILSTHLKTV